MPTSTYIALANYTLSSAAADVTFSSIPATYRDLVLAINGEVTDTDRQISVQLNGDTGSNYSRVSVANDASGTFSGTATDISYQGGSGQHLVLVNFMDYSATDKHKTFLSRGNNPTSFVFTRAHRWANTSPVTSIKIFTAQSTTTPASSFKSGTNFALYGIVS
jgi:hypothetical protein